MRNAITAAIVLLAAVALVAEPKADDAKARAQVAADKAALKPIQGFVGSWRGVGMVDRTKADSAWGEESTWAWSFDGGRAAIVFDASDAKVYKSGRITPAEKAGTFTFTGTLPDGKTTETLTGSMNAEGQLVFTAEKPAKDRPAEITLRTVAKGARMVVVYRKPAATGGGALTQLAEVGYTRKGSGFGVAQKDNECVVTGGEGDIRVEFKGKTYYVCCTGCRDEFNENPEKVLAEFKLKKEEEAKKRAESGK